MIQPILQTDHLEILPLSLQQLLKILQGSEPLEAVLGFPAAEDLISEPVRKANEIKTMHMLAANEDEHPWFTYWLMVRSEENMGIGLLGFKGAPDAAGQVEIGYGISPEYEGRGYTTEAVKALVEWAFMQPRCQTVVAETHRDNLASMRVLVKAGFYQHGANDEFLYWKMNRLTTFNSQTNPEV